MSSTLRSAADNAVRNNDTSDEVDLEVVIPALNEEYRIAATLVALASALSTLQLNCSIVVVDNGSVDGTARVVRSHFGLPIPVRIIDCPTPGKGAAVRNGVLASRARWVGFCDADLATSLDQFSEFIDALRQDAPVVIGSRRVAGARLRVRHGAVRRLGSFGFRRIVRVLVPEVEDTQCGFKFFQGAVARTLFEPMTTNGFAFDVELLVRARRLGHPILELPVTWESREGSTLRPVRHGLRAAAELLRISRLPMPRAQPGGRRDVRPLEQVEPLPEAV